MMATIYVAAASVALALTACGDPKPRVFTCKSKTYEVQW